MLPVLPAPGGAAPSCLYVTAMLGQLLLVPIAAAAAVPAVAGAVPGWLALPLGDAPAVASSSMDVLSLLMRKNLASRKRLVVRADRACNTAATTANMSCS